MLQKNIKNAVQWKNGGFGINSYFHWFQYVWSQFIGLSFLMTLLLSILNSMFFLTHMIWSLKISYFSWIFIFIPRRSTTLSFVWQYSTPTKWHFAAHMGQLMRDTIDSFGRATGCSELWPQCPFNAATLLQINKKDAGISGY